MQQQPSLPLKAAFIASTCFTTPHALYKAPIEDVGVPPPNTSWADVVNSSMVWWGDFHNKYSGAGNPLTLSQTLYEAGLTDDPPSLGTSPMGDSPWWPAATLKPDDLRTCTHDMLHKYKHLSSAPEIVGESDVTRVMDRGIYVAIDDKKDIAPCQIPAAKSGSHYTNSLDVVFDPQYTDQPACCSLKDLPSGDAARAFKSGEEGASKSDDITEYTTDGIKFGKSHGIVYSLLEPTSVTCSASHKCPVVVGVPGSATVPWLTLQAWCTGCLLDLGTIVVSIDNVKDTSSKYVEDQFIPAVQDFLSSRKDVDRSRVYLTSLSKGNEIGMLAVLLHPEMFAFALFAGKNTIGKDIEEAAKKAHKVSGSKLQKISFHIGSGDSVMDNEQDYWKKMEEVLKPVSLPMDMELRYYPGGTHRMWYAGWNAYRDLLWTGKKSISDYANTLTMTCAPE